MRTCPKCGYTNRNPRKCPKCDCELELKTARCGEECSPCSEWVGALAKDMEREEDAAWVAAREADRKDDIKEYNKQLATARTWQAAVRKLRSKMGSAPTAGTSPQSRAEKTL